MSTHAMGVLVPHAHTKLNAVTCPPSTSTQTKRSFNIYVPIEGGRRIFNAYFLGLGVGWCVKILEKQVKLLKLFLQY